MELWKIGLGLFVVQMLVMYVCVVTAGRGQPVVLTSRQRFARKRALLLVGTLVIIPAVLCALWDFVKDDPPRRQVPAILRFLK